VIIYIITYIPIVLQIRSSKGGGSQPQLMPHATSHGNPRKVSQLQERTLILMPGNYKLCM